MVYGYIFCRSCGTPQGPIDHSHNLPKGRFQQYKTDPGNIAHRCRDKCHRALDREDFEKIKNFQDLSKIMRYRREHEPGEYNKFVSGLKEVGCHDYDYVEFDK